jgi:maltose 6'-phosphate phosphatase
MRDWILVALLLLIPQPGMPAALENELCPVPSETAILNVVTVNLLFGEYPQRAKRLADIAEFVVYQDIHLLGVQEVVGGFLDRIVAQRLGGEPVRGNTARELQSILHEQYGVECDLRTGFSAGLPLVYETSNATLACGCRFTGRQLVRLLPSANEQHELAGIRIRLSRSVLMTRLETEAGSANIYNTHLCSACSEEERVAQLQEALAFIGDVESFIPADQVIFLGDFNVNVPETLFPEERGPLVYELIEQAGFADSYADYAHGVLGMTAFCVPEITDRGCTIGVSSIRDPLRFGPHAKRRIDYIFGAGPWQVEESRVVFNPLAKDLPEGPGVSDHSGVWTRYSGGLGSPSGTVGTARSEVSGVRPMLRQALERLAQPQ